jgi:hypothetical protein
MPKSGTVPIDMRSPARDVRPVDTSGSTGPDDSDIRKLWDFLMAQGEADRSQIESMFRQHRNVDFGESWMTNLLTRARRQGWTARYGTRSRPRWVASGSKGEHILWIARSLGFDWPDIEGDDDVPPQFLATVAEHLHLELPPDSDQIDAAKSIVDNANMRWEGGFVSTEKKGITPRGLVAVRRAVSAVLFDAE